MRWLDMNRMFFREHARPVLAAEFPREFKRCACLADGMGSDVLGLEDKLSYDHHVNPRLFVLLMPADYRRIGRRMERVLLAEFARRLPETAWESSHHFGHGVVVETPARHLRRFLDFPHPPRTPREWLACFEQDLMHLTNGEVYHDPRDLITSTRKAMRYFPRGVWKKKIADYCMQYTLAANFNLNRCVLRGDPVGAQVLRGFGLRRAMELAFMLNRRYALYDKWTWRIFQRLPHLAKELAPVLERIAASNDWEAIMRGFTRGTDLILRELRRQKLTREIKSYTPKAVHGYKLPYVAAWDLLNTLPKALGTLEVVQHYKHSKLNDLFMYALTRNQMLDHVHAPKQTWGRDVKPRDK